MTTIVTHSGKFHTDDVFGVAMLEMIYPDAKVVRSRDPQVIKSGDIVLDVGMAYDAENNLFDHHQPGGAGKRENGIPYASFGLVWKKFGATLCGSEELAKIIDERMVQQIDGPDNGVEVFSSPFGINYQYSIESIVNLFRPTWNEDDRWDERFNEAKNWAKETLKRQIKMVSDFEEGKNIVKTIYFKASDKGIVTIDNKPGFGRVIVSNTLAEFPDTIYGIFYRDDTKNWGVVAIPKEPDSFDLRKPFPLSWRGKTGSELESIVGIKGLVMCHRAGYLAIADTEEIALSLAQIALKS